MIRVVCGGKRNERWVEEVVGEYGKRMRRPWQVEWRVVEEGKLVQVLAEITDEKRWKNGSLRPYVILLDERGKMMDSPEFSRVVGERLEAGRDVAIMIGGAYGFSEEERAAADMLLSLSPMVFPHQLCRAIVAEQLYRAQEIAAGRPYHHE